ncbi:hypothetical protein [Shewanella baltica]|uniref:hypothetical protein n=1 Tax=Shewanella baltica TaxID=62322 RepID=UPI00217E2558|nr:hypothetical protein [Shewanella baltica]MCS6175848.1 hypothetical protein [Shewanella baltica]
MIKLISNTMFKPAILMRALVTIDADTNAARAIVMDRNTGEVYHNFKLVNQIHTFVVPHIHTLGNTLLVGILDDNAVYDCKFSDSIMAENINVNAV